MVHIIANVIKTMHLKTNQNSSQNLTAKSQIMTYIFIAHILFWLITCWMLWRNFSKVHNLSPNTFFVPLWPLRHAVCIIKWVPAGVRCPGERGENKAGWREKGCGGVFSLSPPRPPPSNSLLACQVMMEGAARASQLDLTHRGETLTAARGATQLTGKGPARPSVTVGNLYGFFGDVWMNHICTHCARSHADTYPRDRH